MSQIVIKIIIFTLFEAQIWDPLNGCISLLHEQVKFFKEPFLCDLRRLFGSLLLDLSVCHFHVLLRRKSQQRR